jgi:hypothetical protein
MRVVVAVESRCTDVDEANAEVDLAFIDARLRLTGVDSVNIVARRLNGGVDRAPVIVRQLNAEVDRADTAVGV